MTAPTSNAARDATGWRVGDPVGGLVRARWSAAPVLAAAVVSLLVAATGDRSAVLLVWVLTVVWAAVVDARTRRLPDRVVLFGAAVFVAVLVVVGLAGDGWTLLTGALVGSAVLGVPFTLIHVVSPAGFGFGDVKFGILIGLGVGVLRPGAAVVVFATAALLQLAVAVVRPWPAQRPPGADRRSAPFGPALAIAAISWVLVLAVSGGGV